MDLKQFKQLGLKTGDRVEIFWEGQNTLQTVFVKCSKGIVYVEDSNVTGSWYWLEYIKDIKKLKVTKKKEKKGGMTKKQYNELVDIAGRAIPILHHKPLKSLSTLEIGDEVEDETGFKLWVVSEPYICNEGLGYLMRDSFNEFYWYSVKLLKNAGYKVIKKTYLIIDEMIEFWESVNSDNDNGWHIPSYNIVSQFITYLKDLKNQ